MHVEEEDIEVKKWLWIVKINIRSKKSQKLSNIAENCGFKGRILTFLENGTEDAKKNKINFKKLRKSVIFKAINCSKSLN